MSVPVLSVHRISMEPKSGMEISFFTKTPCFIIRIAPCAMLTLMIIGSSSGVTPTATALAKIRESKNCLCITKLIRKIMETIKTITFTKSRPNFLTPKVKASASGFFSKLIAIFPNSVLAPVALTCSSPKPETT